MLQLLLLAAGTFISEDLACISAGVLIAQGTLPLVPGVLACFVGIFVGDVALVMLGRFGGTLIARSRWLNQILPEERLQQAGEWLARRGLVVAFLSRFTPGLRLPTYFVAGLLRIQLPTFSLYLLLAAAIWTPLLVGGTAAFGAKAVEHGESTLASALVVIGLVLAVRVGLRVISDGEYRHRLEVSFYRASHWEFWPAWAAYLPLVPYLIYLAIKHRSATLFTVANPGIFTGGLLGESKSAILTQLDRAPGLVARHVLISAEWGPAMRVHRAGEFMREQGLEFPVVLKPNVGERGNGVAVILDQREMEAYLAVANDTILQEYVPGIEFGIFYVRMPSEPVGRIFSMTWKQFPHVTGDGQSSVRELIRRDERAFCLEAVYERSCRRLLDEVPKDGEAVTLVELGSHCRGSVFVDGRQWWSPALLQSIDRVAKAHDGFFFGRFDVRAESLPALSAGRIKILELNGVGSEATHIYDPAVSLWSAYRTMAAQWELAFEIGAMNRVLGHSPMSTSQLLQIVARRQSRSQNAAASTCVEEYSS